MRILSIQSAVAYGHVGNSAVVFPLQRLGVDVMPVYTVCFSNHTGYGAWRGPMLSGDDVREIVTGIEERGGLAGVDAVLSGYQGSDSIGDAILDAVARVKQHSPDAIYACDPVLGNAASGCHVSPEVQNLIRDRVVPAADLITPNQFELGFLTGTTPDTLDSTLAAADAARALGPSSVLVTSVVRPDRPADTIEMLAVTPDGAWLVQTPQLPLKANGSGDVTAALFTAHLRRTGDPAAALGRTAASVFELLERTLASGERELQLVAAQDSYVAPHASFEVRQIR
ncbi:pyridoxal kinase PdxY [Leucobacter luti]|uniref:pyridoxal kinase n=1 Tax=Leucobacter luti TaxID=340320 RepID=A0A4Q7TND6_9MICO|nr:pyridoxal kinase PdxY [Leucobacter luti]MBL3700219.1 pyridoxal kinase PdxY [Leucobacter luti]RZT61058.1 pyridoxal kinase [Leucobacter luti]